jgi:hypothetical protein
MPAPKLITLPNWKKQVAQPRHHFRHHATDFSRGGGTKRISIRKPQPNSAITRPTANAAARWSSG